MNNLDPRPRQRDSLADANPPDEKETKRHRSALPTVQDSDDLYYDSARKRVYVCGGEGHISVFQQKDADHYELLAKVQTAIGARTAWYFGREGRASSVSTWLFPLVPTMARKCGSTRCRTRTTNER